VLIKKRRMKIVKICILLTFAAVLALATVPSARADQTTNAEFQAQFFKLCDLAVNQVTNPDSVGPYFIDSYAIRALCAAYDMTGKKEYLDACRTWSERMVTNQDGMIPTGAYYMHYKRKPGQSTNEWFAADSSSIGMGLLATSVRCDGAEKKRYVISAKKFAELVIKNYVRSSGGVSDGLWDQSTNEWWCSSGIFGSFLFNLYAVTGDKHYLKTALGVTGWLNQWDLTQDQPFPLSQQGPAMIFYVMENYSAGWRYLEKDPTVSAGALAKVNWCLNWMAEQQAKAPMDRDWPPTKGWGMKFGGLPFHQYIFSQYLPDGGKLMAAGDADLQKMSAIEFSGKSEFTQLTAFLLMAYAERLEPGAIYRSH